MLILTRPVGKTIIITVPSHENIRVTVMGIEGSQVRIGVDAPPEVVIDREEIHIAKQERPDGNR